MARTIVSDTYSTWLMAIRNGNKPTGVVYNCLVSDLVAGDYIVGARLLVTSLGATTGGVRAVTGTRVGQSMTVNWVATSSVRIVA